MLYLLFEAAHILHELQLLQQISGQNDGDSDMNYFEDYNGQLINIFTGSNVHQ